MGQLRRTARRLGADISELAKIRTTEGIVTRTAGGMIYVQRQGQTAEDARPYAAVGDVVPGQRVRLLGDLAIGLDAPLSTTSGKYRIVKVDYGARDDYWGNVIARYEYLEWPARQPAINMWYLVVPADDGMLYHVPAHMPWPQDHTTMLVVEDPSIRDAAAYWVPDDVLPSVAGMAITYLDMPHWHSSIMGLFSPLAFRFGGELTKTLSADIFRGGGGVFYVASMVLFAHRLWGTSPEWNFPSTIVAARLTATMLDQSPVGPAQYIYLPIDPQTVALTANSQWDQSNADHKIVWGEIPPMMFYWVTDADPANLTLSLELAFVDDTGTPVSGVVGNWDFAPLPHHAVTIPSLDV